MHVSLPVSKETMLMGSDTGGEWASDFKQGNNFSISITYGYKDRADRLFNGLSSGGKVTMPMNKTFWGDYFGMFYRSIRDQLDDKLLMRARQINDLVVFLFSDDKYISCLPIK
jgi:hypothetical protein